MGGVRAMPPKQDTAKPFVKPHVKPTVKGKVKCVEPKPETHQKMGEVMVVPEKKKTQRAKNTKPEK
jgi:hypothetical protein